MNIVLDTNILIYHLTGRLTDPLPQANYYISIISEIELLSYPLLNPQDESQIRSFLNDISIIDLTHTVKEKAITIRRQYKLKLPDALIFATALSLDATLLTNDIKLMTIGELSIRRLNIKP